MIYYSAWLSHYMLSMSVKLVQQCFREMGEKACSYLEDMSESILKAFVNYDSAQIESPLHRSEDTLVKMTNVVMILLFSPPQIQWFWRALRSFDQADRAKFLQFVTGTSKVPLQGFAALEGMNGIQKFQIHRDDRSTDRLPSAHTWYWPSTFP